MASKFFLTFLTTGVLSLLLVRYTPSSNADLWFGAALSLSLAGMTLTGIWWIWS